MGFNVRSLFCFGVLCVLSSFAIISLGKRELVALLLLCSECRSLTFPHGAKGWSVVCDCGISWLYSVTFGHKAGKGIFFFLLILLNLC